MSIPFEIPCGSSSDKYFLASPQTFTYGDASLPAAYPTLRFGSPGPVHYRLTKMPLGTIVGALIFVEPNKTAAGQRVMTVTVQGQTSDPIDVFAAVGLDKPYVYPFVATVNVGILDIVVTSTAGNAILSAVQINSLPVSAPAAAPAP